MSQLPVGTAKLPSRSIGVKLIVVCFLAVVMTIPAFFVWILIDDRSHRADEVVNEVSALVGGPQIFVGPIVAVPYTIPPVLTKPAEHGVYIVFPTQAEATASTQTEQRHRSLFQVPVYHSDIAFRASFDLAGVPSNAPDGAVLDWNRAEFLVGASDARGAQSDIVLDADGKNFTLGPAVVLPTASVNVPQEGERQLTFFGTSAAFLARPEAKFDVAASLKFSGAQRLSFLASAKTTTLKMKGDWPHPGFNGTFLPATQNVTPSGFEAGWAVPFIARGVPGQGTLEVLGRLGPTAMGVSFVELADPYQSVTRSLKYAVLFIGLVFLSYFLFEVTSGKRLHPAQYILIGVAQIIFYLLLLSIAERIGFDFAFLLSAVATVGLISLYAAWVFTSRTYGLRALAAFSLLYALIYLLLRLEDQALLIGSIVSFVAISVVMYFTRHLDWYGSTASPVVETGTAGGSL